MITKRRKNTRQRGSTTHGWGSRKKHRGAGNKGGRGLAGTGKRGDANKPTIWGNKRYFGKYGFKPKNKEVVAGINIVYLEEKYQLLVDGGFIEVAGGSSAINLADIGFGKLLGSGKPSRKYVIDCTAASATAVEKIEKAGGKVNILKIEKVEEKTPEGVDEPGPKAEKEAVKAVEGAESEAKDIKENSN